MQHPTGDHHAATAKITSLGPGAVFMLDRLQPCKSNASIIFCFPGFAMKKKKRCVEYPPSWFRLVHPFSKHLLSTTHVMGRLQRGLKRAPALRSSRSYGEGGPGTVYNKLRAWCCNRREHWTHGSHQLTLQPGRGRGCLSRREDV